MGLKQFPTTHIILLYEEYGLQNGVLLNICIYVLLMLSKKS